MSKRGAFITFEGPEGGGKSTQVSLLAARLEKAGVKVLLAREPGGTPLGEAIRRVLQHDKAGEGMDPLAEIFLFLASRAQLTRQAILPALERGEWALCDRFMDSTTAYQGYGRGCDVERIIGLNAMAAGAAVPDLTFLLDIDAGAGLLRAGQRNAGAGLAHDRIERAEASFHERVRAGFLALARRWPARFRVIDASLDRREIEEQIWAAVKNEFGL